MSPASPAAPLEAMAALPEEPRIAPDHHGGREVEVRAGRWLQSVIHSASEGANGPNSPLMERRTRIRRLKQLAVLALLCTAGAIYVESRFAAPKYRGPVSDHFNGKTFENQIPIEDRGLADVIRWRWSRDAVSWDGFEPTVVESEVRERVLGDELRVTFVGHATVLIQVAGVNILTDPVWSERASPVGWVGPKRFVEPGVALGDLPPIDAVLISHNHYDHLSIPTLQQLTAAGVPLILAPLGNKALLDRHDIAGGMDLDWWQSHDVADGVKITCVPAQHFTGRAGSDRMATLWGGFVIEAPGGPIYFAGDTGDGPQFAQVRGRFGPLRLAILPIGAYRPRWFMEPVHVNPKEATEAHLELEAATSLAIHFGCFELADEGPETPLVELDAACLELGVDRSTFWTLDVGEARGVPALEADPASSESSGD